MFKIYWLSIFLSLFYVNTKAQKFVQVKDGHFVLEGKAYHYIGTNYWYAPLLSLTPQGKQRLNTELDFLVKHQVKNLRIVAAAEGVGDIITVPRIGPAAQPTQGVFNDTVLQGLDYLLTEMAKRNMKAVLYLSNNWEWSGGFLQYLQWNGVVADSILQRKISWDETRDIVSKFYSCEPCKNDYYQQVKKIVGRTNSITGKKYTDDPTIMAWQMANEPRPMRPAAIPYYKKWISTTAMLIKSLDAQHLLSIGTEGYIGTENKDVFLNIHANELIDYATIHIWPKNWGWYQPANIASEFKSVLKQTELYIAEHVKVLNSLKKPLVIEEFGFPRDAGAFSSSSTTQYRNAFYKAIFKTYSKNVKKKTSLSGVNFWAFGGTARPIAGQKFWKAGNDYMGDPPMEEQGLYTVFDSDKSTWKLIDKYIRKAN